MNSVARSRPSKWRRSPLPQHDHADSGAGFSGKTLVSRPGAPHDMHYTFESFRWWRLRSPECQNMTAHAACS